MIGFLRKMRRNLLSQNKLGKYLLYAIGEVILVVIGILIAVQINNLNEDKKLKNQLETYKISLKQELGILFMRPKPLRI